MRVLGVNNGHDPSCALLCDGEVVAFIEEERLNRFRHGVPLRDKDRAMASPRSFLPFHSLAYCLEAAHLAIDDLDLIVVANRDLWVAARIPIRDRRKVTFLPEGSHHLAHALAAFFASPFDSAAVLVADNSGSSFDLAAADGPGERPLRALTLSETVERFYAFRPHDGERLPGPDSFVYEAESGWDFSSRSADDWRLVFRNTYPMAEAGWHGLGAMYATVCRALGLVSRESGMDEAGKLMALAAFGPAEAAGDWRLQTRGDFTLGFDGLRDLIRSRGARRPASDGASGVAAAPAGARLARAAQENLERGMLHLATGLRRATGRSRLCLAGGVALNVIANRRLLDEGGFDELFVLPPCNDAGNALGAAVWGHLRAAAAGPRPVRSFFLGRDHEECVVPSAAGLRRLDRTTTIRAAATLLASGRTVAWYAGRSEVGPRALGHRSILADPRTAAMRDHLNYCVKLREPYRPVAPVVLEPYAADWFDLARSPYMLLAARVPERLVQLIGGVVHVDGTARVQTVARDEDPLLYALIDGFRELTGIPMLINTSFNGPGEPLVESPADAMRSFDRLDLDALFVHDMLIERPDPTQVLLDAAPGWRDVLDAVLDAPRNRAFIAHVSATAEISPTCFAAVVASCLAGLEPATLADAGRDAVRGVREDAYLLRRLYFFLRREKLALDVVPGWTWTAISRPRCAAAI
jgi:carbamoyltransferase